LTIPSSCFSQKTSNFSSFGEIIQRYEPKKTTLKLSTDQPAKG